MKKLQVSCDICHAEKKQTNHWFNLIVHPGKTGVTIRPYSEDKTCGLTADTYDMCGQKCVLECVSLYMSGGLVK